MSYLGPLLTMASQQMYYNNLKSSQPLSGAGPRPAAASQAANSRDLEPGAAACGNS
jgi:hypothetical protein